MSKRLVVMPRTISGWIKISNSEIIYDHFLTLMQEKVFFPFFRGIAFCADKSDLSAGVEIRNNTHRTDKHIYFT